MCGARPIFKLRLFARMADTFSSRRLPADRQYFARQSIDRVSIARVCFYLYSIIVRIMNFEYNKVQEISRKIWVYQYYELYQEFSADRLLPGPLLPIHYIANLISNRYIWRNWKLPKVSDVSKSQRSLQLISFEYLNMKQALSLVSQLCGKDLCCDYISDLILF